MNVKKTHPKVGQVLPSCEAGLIAEDHPVRRGLDDLTTDRARPLAADLCWPAGQDGTLCRDPAVATLGELIPGGSLPAFCIKGSDNCTAVEFEDD